MNKVKTPQDVRGYRIQCVNYAKCPICYGCRSFNNLDPECMKCAENRKINICENKLHQPDNMNKLILKERISVDPNITFKSWGKE